MQIGKNSGIVHPFNGCEKSRQTAPLALFSGRDALRAAGHNRDDRRAGAFPVQGDAQGAGSLCKAALRSSSLLSSTRGEVPEQPNGPDC